MKRTTFLMMVFFAMQLSAQGKTERDLLEGKTQVTTKEAEAIIGTDRVVNEGKPASIKAVVINAKMNKETNNEFEALINSENEKNKKVLTAQTLNEIMKTDEADVLSLLLVKNSSKCNVVLKVESGNSTYNMPIPANGQNAIMVKKGVYQLKGNVCELKYESQKDLNKNLLVAIKRMEE